VTSSSLIQSVQPMRCNGSRRCGTIAFSDWLHQCPWHGHHFNDRAEAAAINQIFGPGSGGIPVSSTKPVHGHCLGSAGAIEAIATLIALNERFAPATLNTAELDPACDINVVCGKAQSIDASFALTNNFAFGGIKCQFDLWSGRSLTRDIVRQQAI
jgi:hypothetical protein